MALINADELSFTDSLVADCGEFAALDQLAIETSRKAWKYFRNHSEKIYFARASWTPAFSLPFHGDFAPVQVWLEEVLVAMRETSSS